MDNAVAYALFFGTGLLAGLFVESILSDKGVKPIKAMKKFFRREDIGQFLTKPESSRDWIGWLINGTVVLVMILVEIYG